MTAVLVKSMNVQLKVPGGGEGPWYRVLAITGPFQTEIGRHSHGHFLIKNPDRKPMLHWITAAQIADVTYASD